MRSSHAFAHGALALLLLVVSLWRALELHEWARALEPVGLLAVLVSSWAWWSFAMSDQTWDRDGRGGGSGSEPAGVDQDQIPTRRFADRTTTPLKKPNQ